MVKKYIFITIFIVLIVVITVLLYLSQDIPRVFKTQVQKGLERSSNSENSTSVTEVDIADLPDPVQKYLAYVGVIGREKVHNIRMASETNAYMDSENVWIKMETVEYNFYDNTPSRLALMKFKIKNLPVYGLDSYIGTKGNMLMKPLGLMTVVDAKGNYEDDTSAAVMLLLSMCASAPAALIDDRIEWTIIDSASVQAIFNDHDCKVTAILRFNSKNELIQFSTEDKYYSPTGESYQKVGWSTSLSDYKNVNGLKLSTYGEATWHFPEGDLCYGKNTLKELAYNCEEYR